MFDKLFVDWAEQLKVVSFMFVNVLFVGVRVAWIDEVERVLFTV